MEKSTGLNIEATNKNPVTGKIIKRKNVKPGKCVFPFNFKRKAHYSCINDDKGYA